MPAAETPQSPTVPRCAWRGPRGPAWLLAMVLSAAALDAHAQAVPGPIDPGQLGRELRQPALPRSRADTLPVLPAPQRAVAPPGVAFRVDAVRLEGNTALSTDALRPAFADLIGRSVRLDDLELAAERMTAQYRDAGYLLSQVIVPEQALADGTVSFRAVEGFVDSAVYTRADADAGVRDLVVEPASDRTAAPLAGLPDVLRDYVAKIIASRPLTAAVLERYLLLINDIPGITAHAALAPSPTTVGAAQLTLVVTPQRVGGDVGLDNRLTRSLGHVRLLAGVQLAGALLAQERFSARLAGSDGGALRIGQFGWEQAWGSEGLRSSVSLATVRTRPELALPQTSRSESFEAVLTYPLLRARDRNLYLNAALSSMHSRAELAGGGPILFEDRVRALRLGVAGDLADAYGGVNSIELQLGHGLSGSEGATVSRAGARPHFAKLNGFVSRLQALTPRASLLFALQAQATRDTLYSSEQFAAGGDAFLRAFDPSELIGDRGWAAKLEWRYVAVDGVMVYAFGDRAHVGNAAGGQALQGRDDAASAGLGLRVARQSLSAYAELARPLLRDVDARADRRTRLFGGLRLAF